MEAKQEQKIYAEIVQRTWQDADFKKELIANPVIAIENFTGKTMNIPEGKILVVQDQTNPEYVYFNIPAKPNLEDMELNDEQMEAVAGGQRDPALQWLYDNVYVPIKNAIVN